MGSIQPEESLDLINRLKLGDAAAYEKIYNGFSKELLALAYKKRVTKLLPRNWFKISSYPFGKKERLQI